MFLQEPHDPAVQSALELVLRRQAVVYRRKQLTAVLDGAVLERRIGGGPVMRAQLDRLVQVVGDRQVRLVVVPLKHGMMPGPALTVTGALCEPT